MPTLPHLKFIWGGAAVIPGRWFLGLFGLYDRGGGSSRHALVISVRGLLWWMSGAAVAAYVAGASALFYLWERNPYNVLTYTDALLYPLRRQQIDERKGQAFIAQGTDEWRAKRLHEAASLLRAGLARYPQDFRARLTLAQYYVWMNRRAVALKVMEDGLAADWTGRAYMRSLFLIAEESEDFDLVVRLCARYRARLTGEAAELDRRWLVGRQFAALVAAKRPQEALDVALTNGAGDEAREHRALALLELGRTAEAVALLEEWGAQPATAGRFAHRLLVRAYREAKRFDDMERTIGDLRRAAPTNPAMAVYGVVQRAMAGQAAAADAALTDYLFRFGGTNVNLQLVVEPLGELGEVKLVERCLAAAAERGYPPGPYQVVFVQACVLRGEWATAARVFRQMSPLTTRETARGLGNAWRDWMGALVEAAESPADGGQSTLIEIVKRRPWPMKIYRRTIEALRRAGRLETAREVTAIAAGAFPASEWVRQQGTEIEGQIVARRVPEAVPAPADASSAWTEQTFFAQLDEQLQARRWNEAHAHIIAARALRPLPAWIAARAADFWLAEVRIGQGRGSSSEMLTAAKVYLNGDLLRAKTILDLAREFRPVDPDRALALAHEVRRRSPNYTPAQRTIAEWDPPPAKKK